MCLYTYQKYAKKADKDIFVFKRLCFVPIGKKDIYTPYRCLIIHRNKIAKLSAIEFEKTGLEHHFDYEKAKKMLSY